MGTFIKQLRWMTTGIYMGMFLMAWLLAEDPKKEEKNAKVH